MDSVDRRPSVAWIDLTAIPGVGDNQVLLCPTPMPIDLGALVNVDQVTVEYFDGAGIENLMIDPSWSMSSATSPAPASRMAEWTCSSRVPPELPLRRIDHDWKRERVRHRWSAVLRGQRLRLCEGVDCTTDTDQDGICDEDEVAGCTNAGSTRMPRTTTVPVTMAAPRPTTPRRSSRPTASTARSTRLAGRL